MPVGDIQRTAILIWFRTLDFSLRVMRSLLPVRFGHRTKSVRSRATSRPTCSRFSKVSDNQLLLLKRVWTFCGDSGRVSTPYKL